MQELKRIRNERGWSQRRLAKESGVNTATINQVEQGKRSPTIETLDKLARALDVEVADFFPKVEPPLFEDLVERSRHIQDERRVVRGEFYSHVNALSDDQLRQLADSLGKDLSKGRPAKRLDRLDLWTDPRGQYEEVASRIWTINAMLQIRNGTASERDKEYLAALTG